MGEVEPLLPVPDVEAGDVAAADVQRVAFGRHGEAGDEVLVAGDVDLHRAVLDVDADIADHVVDAQRLGLVALCRPDDPAAVARRCRQDEESRHRGTDHHGTHSVTHCHRLRRVVLISSDT